MVDSWKPFLSQVDTHAPAREVLEEVETFFVDNDLYQPSAADGIMMEDLDFAGLSTPFVKAFARRALRRIQRASIGNSFHVNATQATTDGMEALRHAVQLKDTSLLLFLLL